jgi:hypothetical protein
MFYISSLDDAVTRSVAAVSGLAIRHRLQWLAHVRWYCIEL